MRKKRSDEKKQVKYKLELQPENPQAKKMMWIGVGIFLLCTIIIWGWSIKVKFNNLALKKTPENNLIQKSKQEWNTIFDKDTANTSTTNASVKITTSTTSTTKESDAIEKYLKKIMTTSTKTSSTNN